MELTHPFGVPNLTGFDVRGIAIFDASRAFPATALTLSDRDLGDGQILNADGYTTLYNVTTAGSGPKGFQGYIEGDLATHQVPNGLLNAYKRYITDDPSNTRNAFFAGDSIELTYEVDMPDGPFVFGYAVDACWEPPVTKPVTDPMTDFGPEANCPEPWFIDVDVEPLGPGLTEMGGEVRMIIDVYDYQGSTSHSEAVVECPEILGAGIIRGSDWISEGDGYSKFEAYVSNTQHAPPGEYLCLVRVEDNENAGAPDWLDLTAYQICTLFVVEVTDEPPVAKAAVGAPPYIVCDDIAFHDDGSFDPDGGAIVNYEWDWDNDGTFDETGSEVFHSWDSPGVYQVQFRVTDDESDMDTLDEPLEIIVENELPTAEAVADKLNARVGENVTFDASGSHDNDCGGQEIVEYEWHWGSAVFTTVTPEAVIAFSDPGITEVQLVVTDDEGGQDWLDSPIGITGIRALGHLNL